MLLRVVLADPPKMHRRRPVGHCGTRSEGSGVIARVGLAGVPGHHTPSESWRGGFQVCHGDRPVGRGVRTVPMGLWPVACPHRHREGHEARGLGTLVRNPAGRALRHPERSVRCARSWCDAPG